MTALIVAPVASALAVWLLASMAAPGGTPVYEASVSLRFAGELDVPRVAETSGGGGTEASVIGASSEFAGLHVSRARADLFTPFTTEISDDRRTITFLARDIVSEDAANFARYAARRFWERQGERPISSTPGSVVAIGERELAGTPARGPLAVGLIVFGFAIVAIAGRSRTARRAVPAVLHILLG